MYSRLFFLGAAALIAVIALLTSKFVRTLCREVIFYPGTHCEIHLSGDEVSVQREEIGELT